LDTVSRDSYFENTSLASNFDTNTTEPETHLDLYDKARIQNSESELYPVGLASGVKSKIELNTDLVSESSAESNNNYTFSVISANKVEPEVNVDSGHPSELDLPLGGEKDLGNEGSSQDIFSNRLERIIVTSESNDKPIVESKPYTNEVDLEEETEPKMESVVTIESTFSPTVNNNSGIGHDTQTNHEEGDIDRLGAGERQTSEFTNTEHSMAAIKVEDTINKSKKSNIHEPLEKKILSSLVQNTDSNETNNVVESAAISSTIIHESDGKKILTKTPSTGKKVIEIPTTVTADMKENLINKNQQFNNVNKDEFSKPTCFHNNARYSGTDLPNSIIRKTKAYDVNSCQTACLNNPQCNFFIYFTNEHKIWFKRKECRLLRLAGEVHENYSGHVSGPKDCSISDLTSSIQNTESTEGYLETTDGNMETDKFHIPSQIKRVDTMEEKVESNTHYLTTTDVPEKVMESTSNFNPKRNLRPR
jgi:hypothetical protein